MKNTRFSITQVKSLSDNKIDSNIPNFSNVDVEKNDSENLIIKRDSEYCPENFIGVIIEFLYFLGMLIFFNGLIAYDVQEENNKADCKMNVQV